MNGASASGDNRSSTPPPIPPRPVNIKMNGNRAVTDTITRANLQSRFPSTTPPLLPPPPPPLHNNDSLLLPQRSSVKNQPPLSSASSSESLNDSLGNRNFLLEIFILQDIFSSSINCIDRYYTNTFTSSSKRC